jgi:hypothetical protein
MNMDAFYNLIYVKYDLFDLECVYGIVKWVMF